LLIDFDKEIIENRIMNKDLILLRKLNEKNAKKNNDWWRHTFAFLGICI
jgi:hypothetical protein